LKLLCITGGFLPSIGGMQFSTHQTLLALSELEVDVTLVCPHENGDVEFDKVNPYKIMRSGDGGYLTEIKNLFLVNKLYKNDTFDEVIIMGHFGEIGYGIFKTFLSFKPIILAAGTRLPFETTKLKMFVRNSILYRAYNSAKKIIAISDATIRFINEYCNTPLEKFKKIPRPIDDDIWKYKQKIEHDIFTIVTFSRFEKQKNIQDVLEILLKVKNRGYVVKYKLIGDGEYLQELKNLTKKLGLEKEVEFLGYKTEHELIDILHSCDLHILLSKANNGMGESFGRVYAEAGFIKVLSIGFKTSGVKEAVKDGYSGFLYEFDELDIIEEKIIEIMKDINYLEKLSLNALDFSKVNFCKKNVGQQIKEFLDEK
jgi:glycosyltransferase involved in cell wall biosynthesis